MIFIIIQTVNSRPGAHKRRVHDLSDFITTCSGTYQLEDLEDGRVPMTVLDHIKLQLDDNISLTLQ